MLPQGQSDTGKRQDLWIDTLVIYIITSNFWETAVSRVWMWIFKWAIVNKF